jgi:hypothetical protein
MDTETEAESDGVPIPITGSLPDLEQRLIEQFLADKGYTRMEWQKLSPEQARQVMVEACQYAALKLAEIESTAHLWAEVEGEEKSS